MKKLIISFFVMSFFVSFAYSQQTTNIRETNGDIHSIQTGKDHTIHSTNGKVDGSVGNGGGAKQTHQDEVNRALNNGGKIIPNKPNPSTTPKSQPANANPR